ncbi:hypothetical protein AX17_001723 [Amanita inopinata Kibby_2008]|nr:hypothetical protein AX17_001723 [Amanita inopinata Kibby_2008]
MGKHRLEGVVDESPSKRRRSSQSATPLPARPCDSPSNPFGRQRLRTLVKYLPPATPFSKHLPLRFQLVRTDRPSPRLEGGVHRIVQVPTNYTFMHLRCLIAFLFGGCRSALLQAEGHLFEVKRKIALFNLNYKPGHVKSGQTWAKLSSARDPCRYRPEFDSLDTGAQDDVFTTVGKEKEEIFDEGEEEEPGEWKWHSEEDFTLDRAWPRGCELTRAIIYHHDHKTQIHITINTLPGVKRKGISNRPHVFSGRGRVTLSPPPIPRLVIPKYPTSSTGSKQASEPEQDLTDQDAEGDTDPEVSRFFDDDVPGDGNNSDISQTSGREADNVHTTLDPEKYNHPDAFPHFFSRCQRLARSSIGNVRLRSSFGLEYDSPSSDEESDRGRSAERNTGLDSSSPLKPEHYSSPATSAFGSAPSPSKTSNARVTVTPPPPTSSPGPSSAVSSALKAPTLRHSIRHTASSPGGPYDSATSKSPLKRKRYSSASHVRQLPFHPSPSGFPKFTPLPVRGRTHQMRMKRIEKRMERMKNVEWMKVLDEDEDKAKSKKEKGKGKGKEKVKEKENAVPVVKSERPVGGVRERGVKRGKPPLAKTVAGQSKAAPKPEPGWDPFGDEEEV